MKILFLAPDSISKTILRRSLHLTDRAQISHTLFWYHKATFETLTLHFQKECFLLRPTSYRLASSERQGIPNGPYHDIKSPE